VEHLRRNPPRPRSYPWYRKSEATFADGLAVVRQLIWVESVFTHPLLAKGMQKLSAKTQEILVNWLTQAA
jgi:hypothetical protein